MVKVNLSELDLYNFEDLNEEVQQKLIRTETEKYFKTSEFINCETTKSENVLLLIFKMYKDKIIENLQKNIYTEEGNTV